MMQREGFSIAEACHLAQVSRTGFYRDFLDHAPREADVMVRDAIHKIALENRLYGYRRITAELANAGWVVNHKRVLRLMREDNLLALRKRKFVFTTDSRHTYMVYPNLAADLQLTQVKLSAGLALLGLCKIPADVLNSQGYTQAAWWNRIPTAAWFLMMAIAICCNLLIGYGAHSAKVATLPFFVVPLVVSISLFFIADIDSPRRGIIRVSPQNLISLSQSLRDDH